MTDEKPEFGDRVVARRPDDEVEIWKVNEIMDEKIVLEHTEKTEMKNTSRDGDKKELPVSRKIGKEEFDEMREKESVSLLKDPLEQLYFYGGEE